MGKMEGKKAMETNYLGLERKKRIEIHLVRLLLVS